LYHSFGGPGFASASNSILFIDIVGGKWTVNPSEFQFSILSVLTDSFEMFVKRNVGVHLIGLGKIAENLFGPMFMI
jgi:hypothetical protein